MNSKHEKSLDEYIASVLNPVPPTEAEKVAADFGALKTRMLMGFRYISKWCEEMLQLLKDARSRGILLEEVFQLSDTVYVLENVTYQQRYIDTMLNFCKDPNPKTLRAIIEFYGRDRKRMKIETELLASQIQRRLATCKDPGGELMRTLIANGRERSFAAFLHVRADFGGAELSQMFGVPRSTAYSWLAWFDALPEQLQAGVLRFFETETRDLVLDFMSLHNIPMKPAGTENNEKPSQTTQADLASAKQEVSGARN